MFYFILAILFIILIVILVLKFNPVFGANPTKKQQASFEQLDNYVNGKFQNLTPTKVEVKLRNVPSMMKNFLAKGENRRPAKELKVEKIDWHKVNSPEDSVTWLGHSTFILNVDNTKILVDPMLEMVASPITLVGGKRYSNDISKILDELPKIDAILITHDHYDHLDYPTVKALEHKVNHFFVPLGVDNHLLRWGVPKEKIVAMNWWEESTCNGLTIALTPSQHFSGRSLTNRDTTLWGGWAIFGKNARIFTSGDGGYGPHFKEIGDKYGPFDLVLMECGQYNENWAATHMNPNETVQASIDLNAKKLQPIHWGAFTLAFHEWTDPIEVAIREAEKRNVHLVTSRLCEVILIGEERGSVDAWWREV